MAFNFLNNLDLYKDPNIINQGPITKSIIFTKDYVDNGNNIKKGTIWDNVQTTYGGSGIVVSWSAKKNDGTGIYGSGTPPYEDYQGVDLRESEIEKVLNQNTGIVNQQKLPQKGYTDDFYYSKIGFDGVQLKISERLKKWNDGDVAKAYNMIPDSVIHPDPTVKMAKTTSEIDDAIIVEMERRGLITSGDTYKRIIKMQNLKSKGLMLLMVAFVIGGIYLAHKKYPTATKWVVGIAVLLFLALVAWFWLFFSWGGDNNYEKYFAKYFGKSARQKQQEEELKRMSGPIPTDVLNSIKKGTAMQV